MTAKAPAPVSEMIAQMTHSTAEVGFDGGAVSGLGARELAGDGVGAIVDMSSPTVGEAIH
jgi:hypothetical protein